VQFRFFCCSFCLSIY